MRSFNKLVADGFIAANPQEPEYFEIADDVEIQFEGENVMSFDLDVEDDRVGFCTPLGMEHINEYDAKLDDEVFRVFKVVEV